MEELLGYSNEASLKSRPLSVCFSLPQRYVINVHVIYHVLQLYHDVFVFFKLLLRFYGTAILPPSLSILDE